jgi:ABC-type polar amino acid transport system ATPase subunit
MGPSVKDPEFSGISATGLRKAFREHAVLREVSLAVGPGETVAVIGPSGGGKTTLLRCLCGLASFDAGEIRVGPHRLGPAAGAGTAGPFWREVRRLLGIVFQDFQLFPHLTALENLALAPRHVLQLSQAEANARAMALLEQVGLAGRARAYPRELSGGQKQRVAIARALAMQPRGLLCDEITSALDPELRAEVVTVLEDLRRRGMTLLLVTHELNFARRAADRVVMLADGEIVEEGPAALVLDRPRAERTRRFLGSV